MPRLLPILIVLSSVSFAGAQGRLGAIRDDARTAPPPSEDADRHDDHHHYHGHDCDDDASDGLRDLAGAVIFRAITSPIWVPHLCVGDNMNVYAYFPRFPYCQSPGFMFVNRPLIAIEDPIGCGEPSHEYGMEQPIRDFPDGLRRWSARVRIDYGEDFVDMQRISGHLLLSTSSRFGLDTETAFFEERLPGNTRDQLWMGDCNFVFRFAQSEYSQWRAGIGFNWLDDPVDTNFGLNFTYGVDFFPCQPWVLSSTMDLGKIGHADLFHFRTTVGALVWGFEAYTGYEYYNIGGTQINSLLSGVRIWF